MPFSYPGGRAEPWLVQFWGSLEKLRMGATAKGAEGGKTGLVEVGMKLEGRVSLGVESPAGPSPFLSWPGGTLVLSFPISVLALILVGEEN